MMELKVWVDGLQKVVCGANSSTTCHDVVLALAHSMGRTGRFTLIEKWRESERPLTPTECPLQSLQKWGGYAAEVKFYLVHANRSHQGKETFRHTPTPSRHEPNTDSLKRSSTFSGVHYRSAGSVSSSLNKQSTRTGSLGIGGEYNTNPATPHQLRTPGHSASSGHSAGSSHTSMRSKNYFSVSGQQLPGLISSQQSHIPNTSQHPHLPNTSQHPHLPIPAPRHNVTSPLSLEDSSQPTHLNSQHTHLNSQHTHLNSQHTHLNSQHTHLNSQHTHEINLNTQSAPSPSEKTLHSTSDGSQYKWSPTDSMSDVHAAHHDLHKGTSDRALTSAAIERSVRANLSPSASTTKDCEGKKTFYENLLPISKGHMTSSHVTTHDSVNKETLLTKHGTQKMSFVESAVKNSKTSGAARAPSSFASAVAHLRQNSNDGHLAADKTSALVRQGSNDGHLSGQLALDTSAHVRQGSNDGQLSAFMQVPPRSSSSMSSSSNEVAFRLDTVHHHNIGQGSHLASVHQGSHSRQVSVEIEEYDLDENFPDYTVGGSHTSMPLEYSLDSGSVLPVKMDSEYLQLIQFIKIQGERIDMQEVKLQETSMEISALEAQHWPDEDNSSQLSPAQQQELVQLEQADWASVLASQQQQEENLKTQLTRMSGQLEELETKLNQLEEQEERLSHDLLLAVEESINTEVSVLKDKLLKVDQQIGENNKKLENLKSLISQMEELKQSKSCEEAELEKLMSGKTVKQIPNPSSEPISSPKSPTLTSAADSGETIIKILEGLSSPYPEGLASTFKSQNPNGVWV